MLHTCKEQRTSKNDILNVLQETKAALEKIYDLWQELHPSIQNELEELFADNQGAGWHIYRAMENIDEITVFDVEEILDKHSF